ncbi:MAG TPA: hypothetical protein VLG71_00045 [Candidatus Limnocylindria bacterium]|nr:hypothetical protein [Candidatus Limnocylindria bacterium]
MKKGMRLVVILIGLNITVQAQAFVLFMLQSTVSWAGGQVRRGLTNTFAKEVSKRVATSANNIATNARMPVKMAARYVQGVAQGVGPALDMTNVSTWVSAVKQTGTFIAQIDISKFGTSLKYALEMMNNLVDTARAMTPEQWAVAAGTGTSTAYGVHQTYQALQSTVQGIEALVAELQKAPQGHEAELKELQAAAAALQLRIKQLEEERLKNQAKAG